MLILTYEDRPSNLTGTKLLVLSVMRQLPGVQMEVGCPGAPTEFVQWLSSRTKARLRSEPLPGKGYNVKPRILLRALDQGHEEVYWIDSDIVLHSDFRARFGELTDRTFGLTQDMVWGAPAGGVSRTVAWGLEPGRPMPLAVNSSLLRVTPAHKAMLEHWAQLLDTEEYLKAQAGPPHERGFHMLTDQEPLAAVLGSKPFADIPMNFLRRGRDVAITCGSAGYTLGERFRNVGQGLPPVIHALGPKPWTHRKYSHGRRETWRYIEQVHGQLSPYTIVAREYRELMDEDCSWMDRSTLPAKLMHTMAGGEPNLSALPLCAMDSVGRSIKLALGKYPWQASYREWERKLAA